MNSKIIIQRAALIVVALLVIAGELIIVLDWKEMRQVIGQADWLLLALSFLFAGLSYFCLSVNLAIVFRVFDIKQDFNYLIKVGFAQTLLQSHMAMFGTVLDNIIIAGTFGILDSSPSHVFE